MTKTKTNTGNTWAAENKKGEIAALDMLLTMQKQAFPGFLLQKIREITGATELSGVDVGFFTTIALAGMRGVA